MSDGGCEILDELLNFSEAARSSNLRRYVSWNSDKSEIPDSGDQLWSIYNRVQRHADALAAHADRYVLGSHTHLLLCAARRQVTEDRLAELMLAIQAEEIGRNPEKYVESFFGRWSAWLVANYDRILNANVQPQESCEQINAQRESVLRMPINWDTVKVPEDVLVIHDESYRSAAWNRHDFQFSPKQSMVIQKLAEVGRPMPNRELLAAAESDSSDLRDLFKNCKPKVWDTLLISHKPGWRKLRPQKIIGPEIKP